MANSAVITNVGFKGYQHRVQGDTATYPLPQYVGWGTGTTAAAVTDTGLETAASEARVAATMSYHTTTVTDDTSRWVATITSSTASTQTIAEVVVMDASTGGNCYIRGTWTGSAVDDGESIQFTIDAVMAAS